MIKGIGQKLSQLSTSLQQNTGLASTLNQGSSLTDASQWIGTQAGGFVSSDTITITDATDIHPGQFITVGGTSTTAQTYTPAGAVGEMLTLMKTGEGEFVLSGVNAQKLLMEYFEQAPEMWLRLMAVKAEEDHGKSTPKD